MQKPSTRKFKHMFKIAAMVPETILIMQVLYLCPLLKKTQRKKMRFKKEVGIQDIPTNFMLLTEVTYFEELRVI